MIDEAYVVVTTKGFVYYEDPDGAHTLAYTAELKKARIFTCKPQAERVALYCNGHAFKVRTKERV